MKKNYKNLIGKTKKEVLLEIGFEFNHYPDDTWTYLIKNNWLGVKTFLIIYFYQNTVKEVKTKKTLINHKPKY